MINIVGVRFRTAGRIYYFDPRDLELKRGTHVIVETTRGVEYGTVIVGPKEVPDEQVILPLKEIIRIATEDDETREAYNRAREHEAYIACKEKIREHGLKMKLIKAEYIFDNSKLIFYFTADGRVDFRSLVKDLAGVFRTRIELRQVGVRDETKLLGGIGICGRELCCHTFLSDFAPVSIRMAKEQNLSLNPSKISGVCGRLMCCLKNETETYEYLNSRLPRVGDRVTTPDGLRGVVQQVSVLRQLVKVLIERNDEKEIREYPADALKFRPRGQRKQDRDKKKNRDRHREIVYSSTDARSRNHHKNDTEAEKKERQQPWSRKPDKAGGYHEAESEAARGVEKPAPDGRKPMQKSAAGSTLPIEQPMQQMVPAAEQNSQAAMASAAEQNSQAAMASAAEQNGQTVMAPAATPDVSRSIALSGNGNAIGSVVVHNEKFVQNKAGELSRTTTHDVQAQPQEAEPGQPAEGLNVKVTEEIKVVKEKTIDPSGRPVLKGFEVHETETVKVSGLIPKEPEAARRTAAAAAATIAEAKADALKEAQNTVGRPVTEKQTAEVVKNVLEQEDVPPETADVVSTVLDTGHAGSEAGGYSAGADRKADEELDIIDAVAEPASAWKEERETGEPSDVPEEERGRYPRNNQKNSSSYPNKNNSGYRKKNTEDSASGSQGSRSDKGRPNGYYTGSSTHGNAGRGRGSSRRNYDGKGRDQNSGRRDYPDKQSSGGKDYRQNRSSSEQRRNDEKGSGSEYTGRSRNYSKGKKYYKNKSGNRNKGNRPQSGEDRK